MDRKGGGKFSFIVAESVGWCRREKLCELNRQLENGGNHWKWTGKWERDFRRGRKRGMLFKLTNKKKIILLKIHHITSWFIENCWLPCYKFSFFCITVWGIHPQIPNILTPTILYGNQSLVFKIFIHNFCTNIIS